jgi:hypothetical protein
MKQQIASYVSLSDIQRQNCNTDESLRCILSESRCHFRPLRSPVVVVSDISTSLSLTSIRKVGLIGINLNIVQRFRKFVIHGKS